MFPHFQVPVDIYRGNAEIVENFQVVFRSTYLSRKLYFERGW